MAMACINFMGFYTRRLFSAQPERIIVNESRIFISSEVPEDSLLVPDPSFGDMNHRMVTQDNQGEVGDKRWSGSCKLAVPILKLQPILVVAISWPQINGSHSVHNRRVLVGQQKVRDTFILRLWLPFAIRHVGRDDEQQDCYYWHDESGHGSTPILDLPRCQSLIIHPTFSENFPSRQIGVYLPSETSPTPCVLRACHPSPSSSLVSNTGSRLCRIASLARSSSLRFSTITEHFTHTLTCLFLKFIVTQFPPSRGSSHL